MPNWLSLLVEMFANLGGSLVDKHCLVSEPDPRKNLKEGLGDRLGWKCTEWEFLMISFYPLAQ